MNRIKKLRNSANPKITLIELSNMLKEKGLSFTDSQLSKFENGITSPRSKVADEFWKALSEIFKVNNLYLMGLTDFREITESEKTYTGDEVIDLLEKFATWQKIVTLPRSQAELFAKAEVRKFLLDTLKLGVTK